jgi:hypothetical protein
MANPRPIRSNLEYIDFLVQLAFSGTVSCYPCRPEQARKELLGTSESCMLKQGKDRLI